MAAHNAAARIAAAQRAHDVAWDDGDTGRTPDGRVALERIVPDPTVSDEIVPEQIMPEQISWGELGCPGKIGLYRFRRAAIRVKNIHIIVAENDPAALFTVVTLRPPLGPVEYLLGHRVA